MASLNSCEAERTGGQDQAAGPGISQGTVNGDALVDEQEACARLHMALVASSAQLKCPQVSIQPCPELVRPAGNAACTRFYESSVNHCVQEVATYEECSDFEQRRCVLTSALDELSAGCKLPMVDAGGAGDGGSDAGSDDGGGAHEGSDASDASTPSPGDASEPAPAQTPDEGGNPSEGSVYSKWPFSEAEAQRRQRETADALGLPIEYSLELGEDSTLEFILIPPGLSVLGSPDDTPGWEPDERIRDAIIERAFYLGRYHFTRAQYRTVMGQDPENDPMAFVQMGDSPNQPALVAYSHLRNDVLPRLRELVPEGWGLRLPDEFEWEHAARAGTGTIWYSGDTEADLAKIGWYSENSGGALQDVGLLAPNAWGLYDMVGNIWQYFFKADGFSGDADPDPAHLVKGGCCRCEAFGNGCRTSNFGIWTFAGFRLVLDPP